jgi:formate hydrogenlyase subunit 3/multisubunit Na+/H+ antiporter MnhD subunit
MLQAVSVQYGYSIYQPTLVEFVFAVSLWWLIGLILIGAGAYGLNRSKTERAELLALATLMLGISVCVLLVWYFTPFNHHRALIWTDDRSINFRIDMSLVLMILGTSLLFFQAGRKIGKHSLKHTDPNAN